MYKCVWLAMVPPYWRAKLFFCRNRAFETRCTKLEQGWLRTRANELIMLITRMSYISKRALFIRGNLWVLQTCSSVVVNGQTGKKSWYGYEAEAGRVSCFRRVYCNVNNLFFLATVLANNKMRGFAKVTSLVVQLHLREVRRFFVSREFREF